MNKRKRARMSIYVSLCLYMEEECITHWGVCVLQNCGFIKKKKKSDHSSNLSFRNENVNACTVEWSDGAIAQRG